MLLSSPSITTHNYDSSYYYIHFTECYTVYICVHTNIHTSYIYTYVYLRILVCTH